LGIGHRGYLQRSIGLVADLCRDEATAQRLAYTGGEKQVYTAFGEPISGTMTSDAQRYGYAGAWGYQAHADFPFLHVGHRYYDPSAGRFLQRDPIGIRGGTNIYTYANVNPLLFVDPDGLDFWGSVGRFGIWITGGEESWLDDPATVKKVKKSLYVVALVCAATASGLPPAAKVPIAIAGGWANVWW
jgi:RHS repeat-associated protein